MGRKRKTFDIAELLHTVNKRNASSTCSDDVRAGWNSLLETVLMGADLYAGYGYLEQKNLKGSAVNEKPGIEFREVFGDEPGPCDTLITAGEFFDALSAENASRERRGEPGLHTPYGKARVFPDESRRVYYVAQIIRDAYGKLADQAKQEQANEDRALRRDMLERSRRPEEKGAFSR